MIDAARSEHGESEALRLPISLRAVFSYSPSMNQYGSSWKSRTVRSPTRQV